LKPKRAILAIICLLAVELSCGIVWGIHRGLCSLFTSQVLLVTSFAQIGFVVSVFGLTKAATNFGVGALSDRVGRKPVIILGIVLSGLGGLVIAIASVYEDMLIGTALFGLGQGSSFVGIMVSINELVSSSRRGLAMGLFELAAYGGSSIGSALGGYVALFRGLRFPFYGILVISALGAVAGLTTIPETRRMVKAEAGPTLNAAFRVSRLTLRQLVPIYVAGFSSKIMDSLVWSFLPLYLAGYTMNVAEVAAVTSIFTLSWALSQPLTGYISDRVGRRIVIIAGLVGTAATSLL
jgi:MFS family permease